VVSGFSESGDDLYGAAYYFYGPNSAEYDSLVFWNGVTNGDFLKVKYWTSGSSYSSLCFFSPEGDRLIEQTFQHQFRGPYTTTLLTVYPVAAAPSPLFSRTLSGQAIVSQDRRSIFILSEGSSTILDVASGDSVVRPFTLPSGWTIKAVQTETGTLCAMSSKQVNPQDTVFDWAGIWDLESGQCINQFVVSTHRWIDRETYIMKALFLPSGDRIVVCAGGCYGSWNDGVFLFDVRSGAKVLTYHIPSGIFGISLTPDGRQLLVGNSDRGISCLDAANGRFQRYYSTIYHRGEQGESMFAFNPKNPRQFISGNNIWELPDLLPVAHDQAAGPPAPFRTVRAFKNRITIDLPATAAAATFEINLTNGRSVVKAMVRPGLPSHRSIPVPDLARGVYMYRISAKGGGLDLRGMLLIP
jgi:WD40 repeat protein